jgi:hypothetical protein
MAAEHMQYFVTIRLQPDTDKQLWTYLVVYFPIANIYNTKYLLVSLLKLYICMYIFFYKQRTRMQFIQS